MSLLLINNDKTVLGMVTAERVLEEYVNEKNIACHRVITTGVLDSQSYIEEIETIESDRYRISGITVAKEVFGSEDNRISYYFVAEKLEVLNNNIYLEFEEGKDKEILEDMNKEESEKSAAEEV